MNSILIIFFLFFTTQVSLGDETGAQQAVRIKSVLSADANVNSKISVASDGFKTAYLDIIPKDFDPVQSKTFVFLHGFSLQGEYWLDFIQAIRLVKQGHRVLLPDLMVRGRTLELNFPLSKSGEWNPNAKQQEQLKKVTLLQEAQYIHQLLQNDASIAESSLVIAGHSRGAGVSANLLFLLAIENQHLRKQRKKLRWNVAAHWSFNGFLAYTNSILLGISSADPNLVENPKSVQAKPNEALIYDDFLKLFSLRTLLDEIHGAQLDSRMDVELRTRLFQVHRQLQSQLPALLSRFSENFEGFGEMYFVQSLLETFEAKLEKMGKSKHRDRGLWEREKMAMEATMSGLRTRYDVAVRPDGVESWGTEKLMVPDSTIGIWQMLTIFDYPGIAKNFEFIQGAKDDIIPMKLVQHLIAATNRGNRATVRLKVIPELGHYGPNDARVQAIFENSSFKNVIPSCAKLFL